MTIRQVLPVTHMSHWETYYAKHKEREPRKLLVNAISYCKQKQDALDLGAGTLIESAFLLKSGFERVVAVDNSPEVVLFAKGLGSKSLIFKEVSFRDLELGKNEYDFINAQYSLPFYGPEDFAEFIKKVKDSLRPGGVMTGQFFGIKDGWNVPGATLAFQTREEALEFLSGLQIIEFEEEERDRPSVDCAMKHWHIFNFIAQKQ